MNVWYKLVSYDGSEKGQDCVKFNENGYVSELRKEIKYENNDSLLKGIDAGELKVFRNKAHFDAFKEDSSQNQPLADCAFLAVGSYVSKGKPNCCYLFDDEEQYELSSDLSSLNVVGESKNRVYVMLPEKNGMLS